MEKPKLAIPFTQDLNQGTLLGSGGRSKQSQCKAVLHGHLLPPRAFSHSFYRARGMMAGSECSYLKWCHLCASNSPSYLRWGLLCHLCQLSEQALAHSGQRICELPREVIVRGWTKQRTKDGVSIVNALTSIAFFHKNFVSLMFIF